MKYYDGMGRDVSDYVNALATRISILENQLERLESKLKRKRTSKKELKPNGDT